MLTRCTAPAKLTVTLAVTGVRDDGYHLLESEMVTLDLADTLEIDDTGTGGDGAADLEVVTAWPADSVARDPDALGPAADNLVVRALAATARTARVRLVKRIPPGAGLGGGSADAAAVLRWAGCTDAGVAAGLGADVPFCVAGGRALVTGIGEEVTPLPFEERTFVLVLPPFGVDTAAVYRAFDRLGGPRGVTGRIDGQRPRGCGAGGGAPPGAVAARARRGHGSTGPVGRQRLDVVRRRGGRRCRPRSGGVARAGGGARPATGGPDGAGAT